MRRLILLFSVLLMSPAWADITATGTIVNDDDAGNVANFWFDASGGTCTRQSTAGAYNDGQACATLQAAYAAALCGDVILVANANYSTGADQDQVLTEDASASSCVGNPIIIGGEPGANKPAFRHIRLGDFVGECVSTGPDNITFRKLRVVWGIDIEHDSTHIVVDDFGQVGLPSGSFGLGGGICGAPNNVPPNDIQIINSHWGPCDNFGFDLGFVTGGGDCRNQFTDSPAEGKNKISDGASNLLIENNFIANWTLSDGPGEDPHFECIWVGGGNGVTIRRNRFYNCVTNVIAMPPGNEIQGQWLIENNWMGDQGNGQVAMKFGTMGSPVAGTFIFRFNSLGGTRASVGNEVDSGDNHANISVIGNIIASNSPGCMSGAVYQYNVFLNSAGCDATDETVTTLPYVNTSGLAAGDYHLNVASVADALVPGSVANSGLLTDKDGNSRPVPRSAGAHERL